MMSPVVIAFRPSEALQRHVAELQHFARERSELDDCLQLEHIMVMAKARARQRAQLG
jgi:hypothetical protein